MTAAAVASSPGYLKAAFLRLLRQPVAAVSLAVVCFFAVMSVMSAFGLVASSWNDPCAVYYAEPSFASSAKHPAPAVPAPAAEKPKPVKPDSYGVKDPLEEEMAVIDREIPPETEAAELTPPKEETLFFGADRWGRSVMLKTIRGAQTSLAVGAGAAVIAVIIGFLLGAVSGYFGGKTDDFLNWFYNVFTAVPYLLLVLAVAAVMQTRGVLSVTLILGFTGWTGVYRLVRAEYLAHRSREYVLAATAIGAGDARKMWVHIFPNVVHVALVQLSLLSVGFIKSEVVLSFLGFGVSVADVSWGSMLSEAPSELILGKWWQITAVTVAMAVLVTAFSLFTDELRDALDPKLDGGGP